MDEETFKKRTKDFDLRVVRVIESLPKKDAARIIGNQRLRSATSVGASYRAACRAIFAIDMIAKLAIVEEETDESIYWMEMLVEAEIFPENRLSPLSAEAHEILGMTVASIKTLRSKPKSGSSIQNPKTKIQN